MWSLYKKPDRREHVICISDFHFLPLPQNITHTCMHSYIHKPNQKPFEIFSLERIHFFPHTAFLMHNNFFWAIFSSGKHLIQHKTPDYTDDYDLDDMILSQASQLSPTPPKWSESKQHALKLWGVVHVVKELLLLKHQLLFWEMALEKIFFLPENSRSSVEIIC